ncbi:MAG: type II secretion system F family protein [Chloroflexi bacterium]|nr:type II secretion system F family protein [Chloroflexota bacterium]
MALLLAALMGLAIVMVFVGMSVSPQPTAVQARLRTYGARPRTLAEIELSQPFGERIILPLIRGISGFISRFAPQRNVEELKRKLDLAGNPNNWSSADFLGVRGLAALITTAVVALPLVSFRAPAPNFVLFVVIAAVLGFYLPLFWLNSKIRGRQHNVQRALPDALDLLTVSVEAGLGFDAAIVKVVEKSDTDLSREFARVIQEIRLGKVRREALREMANRIGVPDVTNFIAAVIQADQLGVSLSKVLRIQSEQMRVKRRQRAEELAAQAPVKMMFPLVFLVFPSIMIVLLGPAVLIFMGQGFGAK